MTSTLANGLQKVINMDGAAEQNPKLADLAKDTVNYDESKHKMTTDWGNKVSNTDHWLSASTDDRYGPALLEDGHGREKVGRYLTAAVTLITDKACRFTVLTMSVYRNALYMQEASVPLEHSSCMRAQRTLQKPRF